MSIDKAELKRLACDTIDKLAGELNELSLDIWNHPELCYEERYSHKLLTDYFASKGFPVECSYVVETGFRCQYTPEPDDPQGPNIITICEYDALPGIGHACGHNLIAEVGVAASLGIKAALDKAKSMGKNLGRLTVLGTPAEEGGNGKQVLIDAGALDGVDAALMAHPGHLNILVSPGDTCSATVDVHFVGKESHAADTPWDGINALDAAFMAYGSVSVLRQQMKPSWKVHGIIKEGGHKANIIPGETRMEFMVRTPHRGELEPLKEKVSNCFKAAAISTGCKVEIAWSPRDYLNVITNRILGELYTANAESLGVEFITDLKEPLAGSTDMGNISHIVPGIHPIFYIGTEHKAHTKEFTGASATAEAQLHTLNQAKAIAMTAIDIYTQPKLVPKMKEILKQDLADE